MIKLIKTISSTSKVPFSFAMGVLFGTYGLKKLNEKNVKDKLSHALAKGYKIKNNMDISLSKIKQYSDDIVSSAKDIYEYEKKHQYNCNLDTNNETIDI